MISKIQKLREMTGVGIMECKRALEVSNDDFDAAIKYIHEQGFVKASKKSERKTGAGLLHSYIHNERIGVLLEIRTETDFVVRSEPFRNLTHEIVMQISAMDPQNLEELLAQLYIKDENLTINDLITRAISQLGENIKVERFCRYEL